MVYRYQKLQSISLLYSILKKNAKFRPKSADKRARAAESGTFAATRKGKAKKCIFLKNPLITFIVFYFKEKCKIIH